MRTKTRFLSLLFVLTFIGTFIATPSPQAVWAAEITNAEVGEVYGASEFATTYQPVTYSGQDNVSDSSRELYTDTYGAPFGELTDFGTNSELSNCAVDGNANSTFTYNITEAGNYSFYMLAVEWNTYYPVVYIDDEVVYEGNTISGLSSDPYNLGRVTRTAESREYSLTCIQAFTANLSVGSHTIELKAENNVRGLIAVKLIKNSSTEPEISFGTNTSKTFILGKDASPITISASLVNIPEDATINWVSGNTNIAVVEPGTRTANNATATVTPVGTGSTTITASYTDESGTYSDEYSVTVRNVDYGKVAIIDGVSTTLTVGQDSSGETTEYTLNGNRVYRTENMHNQTDNTATLSNIDLRQYNYDKVEVYVSQGNNNYINATIKVGETQVAVVETNPTGNWNTFQKFDADLTDATASGQVTFTCAQRADGSNNSSGNYVYVRFYNSQALEEFNNSIASEWTNLSNTSNNSESNLLNYAAKTTEDGEQVYNLQNVLNGGGFSYNLSDEIVGLDGGTLSNLNSGYLIVSADISVSDPNSDYFIDLSSDTTIPGWGNGNENIYGRIAGNSGWSNARLCGGSDGTLGAYATSSGINNDGTWTRVSFVVNYTDIQNITIEYDGDYRKVARAGYNESNFVDNLYLNIQPTTATGTTIKVKNISAVYSTTEPIHSGFGVSDTDSGYYVGADSENYGVIRFMQGYSGGTVTSYGFYFVNSEGQILDNSFISTDGDLEADGFYGDLYEIPEDEYSNGQTFYAKGFVTQDNTINGQGTSDQTYFGNSIEGTVGDEQVAYPEATE